MWKLTCRITVFQLHYTVCRSYISQKGSVHTALVFCFSLWLTKHTLVPARPVPFHQPTSITKPNRTVVVNGETQRDQNIIEWASHMYLLSITRIEAGIYYLIEPPNTPQTGTKCSLRIYLYKLLWFDRLTNDIHKFLLFYNFKDLIKCIIYVKCIG